MKKPADPRYRHRFPAKLISHAVWLWYVFSLSFRDVELILAQRGVMVSCESIRRWCLKFGARFANNRRNGIVLDILVQGRRDAGAAKPLLQAAAKGL